MVVHRRAARIRQPAVIPLMRIARRPHRPAVPRSVDTLNLRPIKHRPRIANPAAHLPPNPF